MDETEFRYDEDCLGECTSEYRCYNTTTLCLYTEDCVFNTEECVSCPYYCYEEGKACYDSPICFSCPNAEMVQTAFPDCVCACDNFCTLGYEDLDVSCACKDMTVDTESWQDDPVAMFSDLSAGMMSLFGNIAIPLIIITLALAFASIIIMIGKRAIH